MAVARRIRPLLEGNWSGGGRAVRANLLEVALRHPDTWTLDAEDAVPLVVRNVVPLRILSGTFLYMPQNAWPWYRGGVLEQPRARWLALRGASDVALRRAQGVVRLSSAIPQPRLAPSITVPNVLDAEFEVASKSLQRSADRRSPFFCSGTLASYGNIPLLVGAHARYLASGGTRPLRIMGALDGCRAEMLRWLKAPEARSSVTILTRSLNRRDLLEEMTRSHAIILPARVEASPIRLLESLVLGGRVIASRIRGHLDTAGGAPVAFFDPGSVDELAKCLKEADQLPARDPPAEIAGPDARASERLRWGEMITSGLRSMLR